MNYHELGTPLRAVIEQLDAVPEVRTCSCGAPKSKHQFFDDKIYDVQTLTCPDKRGEYRFDQSLTKNRHIDARVKVLAALLPGAFTDAQAAKDLDALSLSVADEITLGDIRARTQVAAVVKRALLQVLGKNTSPIVGAHPSESD
jgi:hypothetical protein